MVTGAETLFSNSIRFGFRGIDYKGIHRFRVDESTKSNLVPLIGRILLCVFGVT